MTQPGLDEIHVWYARLDPPAADVERCRATLNEDERGRADRFYFDKDKRRFIVARGILKTMLGRYLGVAPEDLRLQYTPLGKPHLANEQGRHLRFNVSHSQELAVYAVGLHTELGIDVEVIRPVNDIESIARHFFSATEYDTLQTVPPTDKLEAFFNCWTRKEAYLKALGSGLSIALDSFEVTLAPSDEPRLLRVHDDSSTASWTLHHLKPTTDSVAAVSFRAVGRSIVFRYWDGSGAEVS